MNTTKQKKSTLIILALFLLASVVPLLNPQKIEATSFTQAYLRLDTIKASTTTGGTVCAKTGTSGSETSVAVTFPSGFTVNGTAANWSTSTTNLPSGATAWPTIGATATTATGQTVTWSSGDLSTATLYCFNFSGTSTLTNNSAGDNQTGTIATNIDSTTYALSIISNDQISVTGTVSQIFTFALSGNTMPLSTISTSAVTSSTSRTVSIGTNAPNGWVTWVKSANGNLASATTGTNIPSPGSINDTPEDLSATTGYVLGVAITTDGGGSGTVSQAAGYGAEYVDTADHGGHLDTNFQAIAASSGTTDGDVLTMTAKAKVATTQAPATDYADTLTVVGAGRF